MELNDGKPLQDSLVNNKTLWTSLSRREKRRFVKKQRRKIIRQKVLEACHNQVGYCFIWLSKQSSVLRLYQVCGSASFGRQQEAKIRANAEEELLRDHVYMVRVWVCLCIDTVKVLGSFAFMWHDFKNQVSHEWYGLSTTVHIEFPTLKAH